MGWVNYTRQFERRTPNSALFFVRLPFWEPDQAAQPPSTWATGMPASIVAPALSHWAHWCDRRDSNTTRSCFLVNGHMIHPYDTSINHENLVIEKWIIISHQSGCIHPYTTLCRSWLISLLQWSHVERPGYGTYPAARTRKKWPNGGWIVGFTTLLSCIIQYISYISIYSHTVSRNI